MSLFVIADLHLSFNENKPMNIFGDNWKNHEEKIKSNWIENVKETDTVIMPGDFSWCTYLKDTIKDFEYLDELPGKKILLKGNHDYWWTTVTSMKKFLFENNIKTIDFLYNNSYMFDNKVIVGTRGWAQIETEEDTKLLKREVARLELSIQDAENKYGKDKEMLVFMHYPPISESNIINNEINDYIKIMKKYNIKQCYYGHLHGMAIKEAIEGEYFGINFKLVSCDKLDFKLYKIN